MLAHLNLEVCRLFLLLKLNWLIDANLLKGLFTPTCVLLHCLINKDVGKSKVFGDSAKLL